MGDSRILERAEYLCRPPDLHTIRPGTSPEDLMVDFDQIINPNQRLVLLFTSLINFTEEPTLEAARVRRMMRIGFLGGMVAGALMNIKDLGEQYKQKHNATLHEFKYMAHRHYYDTLLASTLTKGLSFGIKCSLLSGVAVVVPFASISYRNELYMPDWLVGMGAIGSLSRTWLGPKAMLFGAGVGICVGLFSFGAVSLLQAVSGKSVVELRYVEHLRWKQRRENEHNRRLAAQHKDTSDLLQKDYGVNMRSK